VEVVKSKVRISASTLARGMRQPAVDARFPDPPAAEPAGAPPEPPPAPGLHY